MRRTVTLVPIGDLSDAELKVGGWAWPKADASKVDDAVQRVIENGVWSFKRGDQQIQALVEVGAIPYREQYQPRWFG